MRMLWLTEFLPHSSPISSLFSIPSPFFPTSATGLIYTHLTRYPEIITDWRSFVCKYESCVKNKAINLEEIKTEITLFELAWEQKKKVSAQELYRIEQEPEINQKPEENNSQWLLYIEKCGSVYAAMNPIFEEQKKEKLELDATFLALKKEKEVLFNSESNESSRNAKALERAQTKIKLQQKDLTLASIITKNQQLFAQKIAELSKLAKEIPGASEAYQAFIENIDKREEWRKSLINPSNEVQDVPEYDPEELAELASMNEAERKQAEKEIAEMYALEQKFLLELNGQQEEIEKQNKQKELVKLQKSIKQNRKKINKITKNNADMSKLLNEARNVLDFMKQLNNERNKNKQELDLIQTNQSHEGVVKTNNTHNTENEEEKKQ